MPNYSDHHRNLVDEDPEYEVEAIINHPLAWGNGVDSST